METFLKDTVLHKKRKHLEDFIRPQASALTAGGELISLSLVAASSELRYVERELIYGLTEKKYSLNAIEGQVRELIVREIGQLRARYEVIIFDCPPGISAFTEAVLKSSDLIIAPVIPDNLSTLGLKAFCNRVLAAPRADRGSLKLPWVLANRVQTTRVHRHRLQQMRAEADATDRGFMMFRTEVAQSAALVAAMEYEQEAPTYANKYGDSREPLQAIAREAMEAINAHA